MEILVWVGLSLMIGILAGVQGRNGAGWTLLSIILSPLLVLILLAIAGKPRSDPTGGDGMLTLIVIAGVTFVLFAVGVLGLPW